MVDHERGLAGLDNVVAPQIAVGIDEVASADRKFDGNVDVAVVNHRHEDAGFSAHGRMNGISAEARTVDGIVGIGFTAADDVAQDTIIAWATIIVVVGTWAYASHWKNNDFTKEACEHTGLMRLVKQQKKKKIITGENFFDEPEINEGGEN